MKKILFLINTLRIGGAEKVLINTVNSYLKDKYDITVMTVINDGELISELDSSVTYKSIIRFKSPLLKKLVLRLVGFVLPPSLVHRLFIGDCYDYEIAYLEGIATRIISGSSNRNSKKYAWVHIDLYNLFGIEKVFSSMEKHIRCYEKFDRIICVSKSVKDTFIKKFRDFGTIEVKYNIVDDTDIKTKACERVDKPDKLRVVSVGRLELQKGYDRLLKIHKRLISEGYSYELVLVGEGSLHSELEAYIRSNGLEANTVITGYAENPYKYMQSADLLVFPSRAEGYSTVVTEAIILGKPVVVSDCSGMREILGDSEYGLVTGNNEEDIYAGLKEMISNEGMREQYRQKAEKRSKDFSMQTRLKELEQIF